MSQSTGQGVQRDGVEAPPSAVTSSGCILTSPSLNLGGRMSALWGCCEASRRRRHSPGVPLCPLLNDRLVASRSCHCSALGEGGPAGLQNPCPLPSPPPEREHGPEGSSWRESQPCPSLPRHLSTLAFSASLVAFTPPRRQCVQVLPPVDAP